MAKSKPSLIHEQVNNFLPSISMDCVVFGYLNKKLHVLLLQFKNTDTWVLPGGFLSEDADMDSTISQVLFERTGLENIYLDQFYTFSSVNRRWTHKEKDRICLEQIINALPIEDQSRFGNFLKGRFITTAYLALLDASKVKLTPDSYSDACLWVPIDEVPELAIDHNQILEKALIKLRKRINYLPIGKTLLPEKFTMSDFQTLYEAILGKTLDRGNFQRKIMKLGFLIRNEKLMTGAQNKAPYLYSIDHEVYDKMVLEGVGF